MKAHAGLGLLTSWFLTSAIKLLIFLFFLFFSHDGECIPGSRYWATCTEKNLIAYGHKNNCKNIYRRHHSIATRQYIPTG